MRIAIQSSTCSGRSTHETSLHHHSWPWSAACLVVFHFGQKLSTGRFRWKFIPQKQPCRFCSPKNIASENSKTTRPPRTRKRSRSALGLERTCRCRWGRKKNPEMEGSDPDGLQKLKIVTGRGSFEFFYLGVWPQISVNEMIFAE